MEAFIIPWVVGALAVGYLGAGKRIGFAETVIISLCLSAIIAAIAAAGSPDWVDIKKSDETLNVLKEILKNQNDQIIKNQ